jgi:diguanylate cyclase (GGDEF)-like protein/PAS domain S-box-containing protein
VPTGDASNSPERAQGATANQAMSAAPRTTGFRLVRYFGLTALAAFLLFAAAMLYFVRLEDDFHGRMEREQNAFFSQAQDHYTKRHDAAARADLLRVHEAGIVNLTRLFANALWERDLAPFVAKAQEISVDPCRAIADVKDGAGSNVQPGEKRACYAAIGRRITAFPEFRSLDAKIFSMMKKSTVFKIKVYDLRGITVYSSEHRQIGEDKLGNPGWESAVAGKPASELTRRGKFSTFEGVVENRDFIEIYLSVVAPGSGKIVGVFETYSDVTPLLEQIRDTSSQMQKLRAENRAQLERVAAANQAKVDANAKLLLAIILGLLALLYCALFLIVRRGQRIIDVQDFERRRAEESLRMQGAALDAAANAIVITDRTGTIQWVNRAFTTLTGYPADEAIGRNPRILKSGRHGPEFYRRMFDTILGGSTWQGEIVNRYKDGRLATEEMTITPVRREGGEITNFIAIKQDVTARKEAEMHRERLAAILEASPDFVATIDPERKPLFANSAARRLLELPEDVDLSQIRIGDTHPAWAAELVLKEGIPSAIRDGVWRGETAFLSAGGREIPVIQVILAHKGPDGKVEFLSTIARDISDRRNQELRISRLNRVLSVLSGINAAIVHIRDRQKLFEEACRIAVELGGFGIAWIGMLDPQSLDIIPAACAGVDAKSLIATTPNTVRPDSPLGQGLVGRAVREKRAMFSNDLTLEPSQGGTRRQEALRRGYRSLIVLPLLVDGAVVGNLSLFAKEANFFTDEELKLLNELAADISFALEHMASQEKLDKLSRIRAVSGGINATIIRVRERQALFEETCRIAAEVGKFEMVWIGTIDSEKQEVQPVVWRGFSNEAARAVNWAAMLAAQGTLGEAIRTRRTVYRNDIEIDLRGGKLRQEALERGCGSAISLPLVVDDNVVAIITLFAAGTGFFDDDERALLDEVAADLSFALQSIARQEKLEYLSYYDTLTGLPNRQLFVDRLGQQMRARGGEQRMVALILLDLERFRNINETLGRHGGDELLKLIGRRLEHAFHGKDYLARIGGNSYGVVIRGVQNSMDITRVVERQVLACFGAPFQVNDRELHVVAKVGIAMFPVDGRDADTLFRNAEAALRKAKDGGERFLFYAVEMNAQAVQTLSLETRMRKALEADQFVLHYQPKVELARRRVCGLEALIRWNDPETGMVLPGSFIPLLEETGLILEVGRWALAQAMADYSEWTTRGRVVPRIAVNVSALQLQRDDFVDVVASIVRQTGGLAQGLEIEITESMLMKDVEASIRKLSALRELGIHVAMDDFGTGYSSLKYLARLPVDVVKIDRSFIDGVAGSADAAAIVTTMIALSHSLNLRVVAEGVETEEQAQLLWLLKCDEMQGYLISPPLPAAEAEARFLGATIVT